MHDRPKDKATKALALGPPIKNYFLLDFTNNKASYSTKKKKTPQIYNIALDITYFSKL